MATWRLGDPNTRAFAVILGSDADPELVRNSIRLIPGVDTVSAQSDNGIAALRDTLAWYADEDNYICRPFAEGLGALPLIDQDSGQRAREALSAARPRAGEGGQ